ncbi:hypothetical protein COL00_05155 [Bacillus cereus]|uniref:hypothetical protein n=1 Tax=Bacillus cereus TaxID=1396 RepID=UPI000BF2E883|nr:hypothetical protein [Bacillus cereus]PFV57421.1 hypothetical protein COL00_05155 [Bacillus cereus]
MENSHTKLLEKLLLFHPYLKKANTIEKLDNYIKKFKSFKKIYQDIKSDNNNDDTSHLVAKTLIAGLAQKEINEYDLDELLFLLLEDSLFNSYLFKLQDLTCKLSSSKNLLDSWSIPKNHKILSNINKEHQKDFVICGYRESNDDGKIESLRLLLLDSKKLEIGFKNEDTKEVIFPTIVEIDFRRSLLHIRLKDVDNIVNETEEFSTMSGRIKNTLAFIDSFKPEIQYKGIENFRKNLYAIEEHLLRDKRELAHEKLKTFDNEINKFTELVCNQFLPPQNTDITPKQYISNSVLSIISSTVNIDELGDIVGIKFRNNKDDNDKKYAEITIRDKGFKCISTNNLYWLNLPVLQHRKAIEFLQLVKIFPSGTVIANLEFSLNTANIRILQKTNEEITDGKPTQEKYDDFINFVLEFI